MTNNEFFSQLLGLTPAWRVSNVDADLAQGVVHVYVDHDPSLGRLRCSTCGQECAGYDRQEQRYWRHLDLFQYATYLVCSLPRVECPTDGVRPARAPWTEPNSRFTILFEQWAIVVLQATGVQRRAAKLLRLSPDQIRRIMHRAVSRGLDRRSDDDVIETLGIDEKSFSEGHKYATVLSDTKRGRVLDLIENRTKQAAASILRENLTPAQRLQVRSISMDMWPAFAYAARKVVPSADIVHDRYHVAGYLNEAVDNTRKSEHTRLAKKGSSPLKSSKYVWLKSPENLTGKSKALFEALSQQDLETGKVWAFKDAFRDFYGLSTIEQAQAFFDNWYDTAIRLGNRFLTKVANMLKSHLDGLLAFVKHRTTNATAEAINAKIQLVKANARGYRKFQNLRVAVLFFHGKLQLNP